MSPPMYHDSPLAVIPTPKFTTGKTDPFTLEASHMALSHNSFIRGLNSIHQQAPRVRAGDKDDFVGYCLAWHDCIAQHHHYEETEFFPALDRAAGRKGLLDTAVDQHAAFHAGLQRFSTYLLSKGADFAPEELLAIMDSFSAPLHLHLKEEPALIADLARYSTPDNPIDILAIAAAAGKKQVSPSFLSNVLPVFLNMESVEFEGGLWHDAFPPVAAPVRWIMLKAAPLWQYRRWRFASCAADGARRRLAA